MVAAMQEAYRGPTPKPYGRNEESSMADRGVEDSSVLHAHRSESNPEDSRLNDSGDANFKPNLMQGDARGSMGDSSSSPDHGRRAESRRQSSSQQSSSHRHHGPLPTLQTNIPPQSSGSTSVQGTHTHYYTHHTPQASYNQGPGYVGYTMPAQPPIRISHSPRSFPYYPPYTHSGGANMMPPNVHTYRPMLQPSMYPYQRHSAEQTSPAFTNTPVLSHQANPATPSGSPLSPPSSSPVQPPYPGSGQFHPLQYQKPLASPRFGCSQALPSPSYQSQYAPGHYQQPFTATQETEGQGTWWYLPHGSSLPGQAVAPQYQGSHAVNSDTTYIQPRPPYPTSPSRHRHDPRDTHPSSHVNVSSSSPPPGSSSSSGAPPERAVVRRSYHPNPPAHRSEWVMWVGNVPSDASHDELWRFFVSVPGNPSYNAGFLSVVSIFLISRSNCAFVNFQDEEHLTMAITRFNGQPLRPNDPRCPLLLCRTRKKDDDLKTGVGGQRGMGMHTKWVKNKKGRVRSDVSAEQSDGDDFSYATTTSFSGRQSHEMPPVSPFSDEDELPPPRNKDSSSSGSFASTNSSMLTKYFPSRYFILKSLTQHDVDLSVKEGLWATQRHNEGILDRAYRTSKEVYLIFGVNKTGEFYGYAKMAGPVRQGDQRVSWAQRTDSSASSRSSISPAAGRGLLQSETIPDDGPSRMAHPRSSFTDHLADESPMGNPGRHREISTAPAEMQDHHRQISVQTQRMHFILDQPRTGPGNLTWPSQYQGGSKSETRMKTAVFHLDENAPMRATRAAGCPQSEDNNDGPSLRATAAEEEETGRGKAEDSKSPDTWGEPFRIEWISMERLPFNQCRHIRNPWNHDREVKVSRDGTELEPGVGKMLIEEWEGKDDEQEEVDVVPEAGAMQSGKSGGGGGGSRGGNGAGPRGTSRTKSLQAAQDLRETSSA